MPDGEPSLQELVRRVARLEDRLDARTVSTDVYQAEKTALTIQYTDMSRRLQSVEDSIQAATRLVVGAFLGIIVNGLLLAVAVFGGRT
jgi:outer membrane lipoprotein SlyB